MKIVSLAGLWLGIYLLLMLAPLVVLLASPTPARGNYWREVALGLGFAGLAMMVMQFFLTARLRKATAPFGIDVIFYFHRYLGWVLLGGLLLHPLLLAGIDPSLWRTLVTRPDAALHSGLLALVLLVLIMITSAWRKRLHFRYHHWRRAHLLLALGAIVAGFVHMYAIGYYSTSPYVEALWIAIAGALVLLVLWVHLLRPWRLLTKPWRVTAIRPEQGEAWTLTVAPVGHGGFAFLPGQFAWLSLGHSPFSMQEHPFSIASAPRADGSLDFTIKALGDFTNSIGAVQPGTLAYVDGPYGVFSCERYPQAAGYVFCAGGIGLTPILAMLQGLAARGDTRPHVLFAAHSRYERIPRRTELVELATRLNLRTVPVLEEPPENWQGATGWITQELLERHLGPQHRQHEFFICGPKPMTSAVEHILHDMTDLRLPLRQVHTELFDMA